MQHKKLRRKEPAYPIESVNNALVLLEILRDFGPLHLKDAAKELGVSRSTAHRLLAMLVYRGFAEQDESHRYVPGPALGVPPAGVPWTAELRQQCLPQMKVLSAELDETVNLVVRAGTQVHFLATVQGSRPLRVGDRKGEVMPARLASAGKAILATLSTHRLRQLYEREAVNTGIAIHEKSFGSLKKELDVVRELGFAANFESTEIGVSALGVALRGRDGEVLGGLSVSMAPARFTAAFESGLPATVRAAQQRLEEQLSDFSQ